MPPVLHTDRLTLVPLDTSFADVYDARECASAEVHWAEHGFGHDPPSAGIAEKLGMHVRAAGPDRTVYELHAP